MKDNVGEGRGLDWKGVQGTPETPPASQQPETPQAADPSTPAQQPQDSSAVRGIQRGSASTAANLFGGASSFTNWEADGGQSGPERGAPPFPGMPPISDGPSPRQGSGGMNAQTLRFPSDDGAVGPEGPGAHVHAETLRFPSDDGAVGPEGPGGHIHAETLRYPSDDGGSSPTPSGQKSQGPQGADGPLHRLPHGPQLRFPTLPPRIPHMPDAPNGRGSVLPKVPGHSFPTLPPNFRLPTTPPATETLAYPSDDGGTPPSGGPATETLAYPSDDGGTAPSGGPATETLAYPSDDGGTPPASGSKPILL